VNDKIDRVLRFLAAACPYDTHYLLTEIDRAHEEVDAELDRELTALLREEQLPGST
jgi:hypothetical protein